MQPLKKALPVAVAVGMVAAAPAAAQPAATAAHAGRAPVAHLLGGDAAPPVYPGLVNSRLVRTQKVLDRAIAHADDDEPDKSLKALYKTRLQLRLAWKADKYVIDHAPPPAPAGDGSLKLWSGAPAKSKLSVRAHASGGAVGGGIADQFATTGAVLALQHTVAQAAIGAIDTSHGTLRDSLSRTIFTALDQRDTAVSYIHSIDVPPPVAGDGAARVSGFRRVAGGALAGSWATIMPPVGTLQVQDEVDQMQGALDLSATMGAGIRRVLKDAMFQDLMTQRAINQYWPPVVGDG